MNTDEGIKEGLDEKNAGGYVKVIVYILLGGITFMSTQYLLVQSERNRLQKEHQIEIKAINIANRIREDSISISTNARYQIVLDRERLEHKETIILLNGKIDKLQNNSDVNSKLARSNDSKTKRNKKVLDEAYRETINPN